MSPQVARYFQAVEATLNAALAAGRPAESPGDGAIAMDAGLPFVALVCRRSLSADTGMAERVERFAKATPTDRVVDGAGQSRSVYRGLLLTAACQAVVLDAEHGTGELGSRLDLLPWARAAHAAVVDQRELLALPRATDGAAVVEAAWLAVGGEAACRLANMPDAADECRSALAMLVAAQQDDGSFLDRTDRDNPEPRWYHEAALLHAVATHAADAGNANALAAAGAAADFFAAEVQPDHATGQPWAVHALLVRPDAVPVADLMLHAAGIQQPSTMDAASLLLLADALRCLPRLLDLLEMTP